VAQISAAVVPIAAVGVPNAAVLAPNAASVAVMSAGLQTAEIPIATIDPAHQLTVVDLPVALRGDRPGDGWTDPACQSLVRPVVPLCDLNRPVSPGDHCGRLALAVETEVRVVQQGWYPCRRNSAGRV